MHTPIHTKVKDSINLYYERVDVLKKFDIDIAENFHDMKELLPKVFSMDELKKIFNPANDNLARSAEKFNLRSTNADLMNELAFYFYRYRSQETQYLKRARALYRRIPALIIMIKKEYHLN